MIVNKSKAIHACGRRRDLDDLIVVLDAFVPAGSELHLYNEVPIEDRDRMLLDGGLNIGDLQVGRRLRRQRCRWFTQGSRQQVLG